MFKKITILTSLLLPFFVFANELPTSKISLEVKQAGVRDVIENMLKTSNLKYEIDPQITNATKVSIEVKKMEWSSVFQDILNQSKLVYNFDQVGKIHIAKR